MLTNLLLLSVLAQFPEVSGELHEIDLTNGNQYPSRFTLDAFGTNFQTFERTLPLGDSWGADRRLWPLPNGIVVHDRWDQNPPYFCAHLSQGMQIVAQVPISGLALGAPSTRASDLSGWTSQGLGGLCLCYPYPDFVSNRWFTRVCYWNLGLSYVLSWSVGPIQARQALPHPQAPHLYLLDTDDASYYGEPWYPVASFDVTTGALYRVIQPAPVDHDVIGVHMSYVGSELWVCTLYDWFGMNNPPVAVFDAAELAYLRLEDAPLSRQMLRILPNGDLAGAYQFRVNHTWFPSLWEQQCTPSFQSFNFHDFGGAGLGRRLLMQTNYCAQGINTVFGVWQFQMWGSIHHRGLEVQGVFPAQ